MHDPVKDSVDDSVEVGAAAGLAEVAIRAMALTGAGPMLALLQAEAEALAALMPGVPGTPEAPAAEAAREEDPFDNMPV